MPTFSAEQILDKTLIAKKRVKVYNLPTYTEGAREIATVAPGQSAGVVFSYTGGTADRPLNWQFKTTDGRAYYIPHEAGAFDVSALRQQGVLTTQEIQQKEEDQSKDLPTKIFEGLGKGARAVFIAGVALAALYLILQNRKK